MGKINTAFDHIDNKEKIKELSVVLYPGSFFYGFWDETDILVKSGRADLNELSGYLTDTPMGYPVTTVRIMSTYKPYLHMPGGLFKKKESKKLLEGIYPVRKVSGQKPRKDAMVNEDIDTFYFLEKDIVKQARQLKLRTRFGHISTALANYAFLAEEDLVSYVSDNTLHISYSRGNQFKFYNQFECYHKEDFLYFYLLSMHGLELNPGEEPVSLGGWIDENSALFKILKSYLPRMSLKEDRLEMESVFPKHYYFDLYLAKSCV